MQRCVFDLSDPDPSRARAEPLGATTYPNAGAAADACKANTACQAAQYDLATRQFTLVGSTSTQPAQAPGVVTYRSMQCEEVPLVSANNCTWDAPEYGALPSTADVGPELDTMPSAGSACDGDDMCIGIVSVKSPGQQRSKFRKVRMRPGTPDPLNAVRPGTGVQYWRRRCGRFGEAVANSVQAEAEQRAADSDTLKTAETEHRQMMASFNSVIEQFANSAALPPGSRGRTGHAEVAAAYMDALRDAKAALEAQKKANQKSKSNSGGGGSSSSMALVAVGLIGLVAIAVVLRRRE